MEVYAKFSQKVTIDPIVVMKQLYEKELYWRNWVFEKDGKYYEGSEQSAGCHSFEQKEEISKERYEYIQALKLIISKLERDA